MKKITSNICSVCTESVNGFNIEVEKALQVGCNYNGEVAEEIANSFHPAEVYSICKYPEKSEKADRRSMTETVEYNNGNLKDHTEEDYDLLVVSVYPPFDNFNLQDMYDIAYDLLDYNSLFVFLTPEGKDKEVVDNSRGSENITADEIVKSLKNSNLNYIKREEFVLDSGMIEGLVTDKFGEFESSEDKVNCFVSMKV